MGFSWICSHIGDNCGKVGCPHSGWMIRGTVSASLPRAFFDAAVAWKFQAECDLAERLSSLYAEFFHRRRPPTDP
jgi:hypothetical protein